MTTMQTISQELQRLVETLSPSVVMVGASGATARSGLVLDGAVITVATQAEPGDTVELHTGAGVSGTAAVERYYRSTGITVLGKIEPSTIAESAAPPEVEPAIGALAFTLAYPAPDGVEARLGMVRATGNGYFQTDSPAFPGFAGAPVFDAGGALLGITVMGGYGNQGHALPVSTLRELLAGDPRSERGAGLGVNTQHVDLPQALAESTGQTSAALVTEVAAGSPAEAGGVQFGDVLLAAGEQQIDGPMELAQWLTGQQPGAQVAIGVLRSGERQELTVQLGEPYEPESSRRHGHGAGHGRRHRRGAQKWRQWLAAQMMG